MHPTTYSDSSVDAIDLRDLSLTVVSTYPPTRCGVGRFTRSLITGLETAAPNAWVRVARLVSAGERAEPSKEVELVFDPSSSAAIRAAGRRMNKSDVVLIQHEFGLYGPDDGIAVLELVEHIDAPILITLHTVVAEPSDRQRRIVTALSRAGLLIVPSEVARRRLLDRYGVDPSAVSVIPHGAWWKPAAPNEAPRRRLITWGLLGPGKGIERSLRAVAEIDLDPPVTYDIVGQIHPKVLERDGDAYRTHLMTMAAELGIDDRVRFTDRYLEDHELYDLVTAADLVVVPYDNHEQICSGVLTEAIAAGRPVVSTAFAHAVELLSDGSGLIAPHSDKGVARAIRLLLEDDRAYSYAASTAAAMAPAVSWESVAGRYLELATATRRQPSVA